MSMQNKQGLKRKGRKSCKDCKRMPYLQNIDVKNIAMRPAYVFDW